MVGYYCFVPSFDGSRCWGFSFEDIVEELFWASRGMKLSRIFCSIDINNDNDGIFCGGGIEEMSKRSRR